MTTDGTDNTDQKELILPSFISAVRVIRGLISSRSLPLASLQQKSWQKNKKRADIYEEQD